MRPFFAGSGLMAVALSGMLGMGPTLGAEAGTQKALPGAVAAAVAQAARPLGFNGLHRRSRTHRPGPGWSVPHVKRMACKRRNQARHREACKRAGGGR